MKSRAYLVASIVIIAIILLTGACSAGFLAGRAYRASANLPSLGIPEIASRPVISDSGDQANTPTDLKKLFEPFWQTWDLIHEQYVDQPVDDETLMRGAIKGMLESLGDQYTSYLDPAHADQMNALLNGLEYEGIGAWVDISSAYLKITSPMPDSPAEKAGLKPGDQIIAVDGEDMTGVDGTLVLQRVKGPEGTTVRLTILREGLEPFDVDVQRAKIVEPTVETRMLEKDIGYVRLFTFGEKTTNDLHAGLKTLMAQKPAGLVLDLRNNPGGYLETAVDVASEFIGDGVVMYQEYGDGSRTTYKSKGKGLATGIPLVVLINEGSASASEIVAGAVQDRGRGQLVGAKSYGKGSVQVVSTLVNDQGQVRITIARWLTPNGTTIHKVGLTPDFDVQMNDEDVKANRDPQLEKAVELLK